jgi:hypothetical protein
LTVSVDIPTICSLSKSLTKTYASLSHSQHEFQDYEILNDLTIPARHKHSSRPFYTPEPIGIGTPDVESLSSYLLRICDINSLRPDDLIIKYIFPKINLEKHKMTYYGQVCISDNTILNDNELTSVLERLINRSDLKFLAVYFWSYYFSDLLRLSAAWCPECFQEWGKGSAILHLPLKWSINAIKICDRHHRRLSTECPHPGCGNKEFSITSRYRLGYCPSCNRWLGNPADYKKTEETLTKVELSEQSWATFNVGHLIARTPNILYSTLKRIEMHWEQTFLRNMFLFKPLYPVFLPKKNVIEKYVNRLFEGKLMNFASTFDIPINRACKIYIGDETPTLEEYLKFSRHIKVPLVGLLVKGSLQPTPNEIRFLMRKNFITRDSRIKTPNLKKLGTRLKKFLNNTSPPYSLRETASQLGYTKDFLQQYFPDLSQKITNKFSEYQKIPFSRLISNARVECVQKTIDYFLNGLDPSFNSKINYSTSRYIVYYTKPVILEWVATMKKLGYNMVLKRYNSREYSVQYHTFFDKSPSPQREVFRIWEQGD